MHSIDDVVKQSIPLQGAGKIVSPLPPSYSIRTGFSHTFSPLIYTIYTEIAKNETNFICQVPVDLHSPSYHIAKCMHAEWQGYDHTALLFLRRHNQEVIAASMSSDKSIFSTLFWILYFSQRRHCSTQQLHFSSCSLLQSSIRLFPCNYQHSGSSLTFSDYFFQIFLHFSCYWSELSVAINSLLVK